MYLNKAGIIDRHVFICFNWKDVNIMKTNVNRATLWILIDVGGRHSSDSGTWKSKKESQCYFSTVKDCDEIETVVNIYRLLQMYLDQTSLKTTRIVGALL